MSETKPRCRDCKWLDTREKHAPGFRCTNPDLHHPTYNAKFKKPYAYACLKGYAPREETENHG